MYSLDAVMRRVEKEGLETVIQELTTANFSEQAREDLIASGVLVNGYPNLSLIYSLSKHNAITMA